jgi:hypothetical protein
MNTPKLVYSVFLPFTIWLLFGAPDILLTGNLLLLLVVILHLFTVIWFRSVFALFHGDAFTYGTVALGFNISSFVTTFVTGFITFWAFDRRIETVTMISPISWGAICIGFLVTIAVPVLTTRHVNPLPKASSRREYQDPNSSR